MGVSTAAAAVLPIGELPVVKGKVLKFPERRFASFYHEALRAGLAFEKSLRLAEGIFRVRYVGGTPPRSITETLGFVPVKGTRGPAATSIILDELHRWPNELPVHLL